jgi:hypothetical protein
MKFKDKPSPSVKCESELKMPCESSSTMDMRHLSNKLLGICEEEFQKKLGSVLRNLVDKLEAEVRTYEGKVNFHLCLST